MTGNTVRRQFLRFLGLGASGSVGAAQAQPSPRLAPVTGGLGNLYLARGGRRRRASSWDRSGGNSDRVPVEPGDAGQTVCFELAGTLPSEVDWQTEAWLYEEWWRGNAP